MNGMMEASMVSRIPSVGAPDHTLRTSPILDEGGAGAQGAGERERRLGELVAAVEASLGEQPRAGGG